MTVPGKQIQTWSKQGAVQTAEATHRAISKALASYNKWPGPVTYDVYLQGSYRNSTNVVGASDVDVIVECTSSVFHDMSRLSALDRWNLQPTTQPIANSWTLFRRHVIRALRGYFGDAAVVEGKHSLKLARTANQRAYPG